MYFKTFKCWWILKSLIILIMTALFLAQMVDIWNHFIGEDTFVAISKTRQGAMKLPHFTFCPLEGFKSYPDPSSMTVTEDHLFQAEDIFQSLYAYPDFERKVELKATPSAYFMMCQTLSFDGAFALKNYGIAYLKNNSDYVLYIHDPGEEFWLHLGVYPYEMTTVKLKAKNLIGNTALDVILRKQVNHYLKYGESGRCQTNLEPGDLVQ